MTSSPLRALAKTVLLTVVTLTTTLAATAQAGDRPDPTGREWRQPARDWDRRDGDRGAGWSTRPVRPDPRWYDNAHGHGRYYPTPGWRVAPPPHVPPPIVWRGHPYRFAEGVWYAPAGPRWNVIRPPMGIVVDGLPDFRTAVVLGGITYFYLNGVYYRERPIGGYEVVQAPADSGAPVVPGNERLYVYPRQGQSAERQDKDEYECHRWAADQTGFDPTESALGQTTSAAARDDYARAQRACLEGRGYSVR